MLESTRRRRLAHSLISMARGRKRGSRAERRRTSSELRQPLRLLKHRSTGTGRGMGAPAPPSSRNLRMGTRAFSIGT